MTQWENIPQEMREKNQWVCVRADSKVPLNAKTGTAASSADPETWSSFGAAKAMVDAGHADNVGYVFNGDLVGIDLDEDVFDEDGFLTEKAFGILSACQSYTERSRSGRGFHVILKGTLPFSGRNNRNGVEIYTRSRYFIVTGQQYMFSSIVENQKAIEKILDEHFPDIPREGSENGSYGRIYTPVWEDPIVDGKRIKLRPVYPRIPEGSRNICLTSLAGILHSVGYGADRIFDELCYANMVACDPPVSRPEIRGIVNSVTRYKR